MTYIDFDGVILDTEPILFDEWKKKTNLDQLTEEDKIEYIKQANWKYILDNSEVIRDSIYILRNMNPKENIILTRVHSLENEGAEKIKYLRRRLVELQVILAPYNLRKDEVVEAYGNILIDDSLRNLSEWKKAGGYPIFFDKDDTNIDSWGYYNNMYQKTLTINPDVNKCQKF